MSGGLDHHVRLWDIHRGTEQLDVCVTDEGSVKGSIYALAANQSLIASGGPENIVKLWDSRSGKRASQLIGHTDIIRSILLSDTHSSDLVISASADRSIKLWSLTAGRCIYSLSMHSESIWTLHSDHPDLDVLYSGDRSGMIIKTDLRDKHDLDEGYSIGICQENEGINCLVAVEDDIWAGTANSGINRWRDISRHAKFQRLDDARNLQRAQAGRAKTSISSIQVLTTPPLNSAVVAYAYKFCFLRKYLVNPRPKLANLSR